MAVFFPVENRKELRGQLLWFASWAFITGLSLMVSPSKNGHGTHQQLGLPACPSVALFGRPCPSCGLTTSFAHSVRGEFVQAYHSNMFGPLIFLAFTVSALFCLAGYVKKEKFVLPPKACNWTVACFLTIFLSVGIWRAFTASSTYKDEPNLWDKVLSKR